MNRAGKEEIVWVKRPAKGNHTGTCWKQRFSLDLTKDGTPTPRCTG
jgi:hypothetical protein